MSFWDTLGDVWDATTDGLKWVDNNVPQPGSLPLLGITWATAKNSGLDNKDAANLGRMVAVQGQQGASASIGEALHKPYQAGVAHPLAALFTVAHDTSESGLSALFEGQTWTDAWEDRGNISPGQALFADSSYSQTPGAADRKASEEIGFKLASGAVDLALNIFADPLVIGGKVAKTQELARTVIKAEDVAPALKASVGDISGKAPSKTASRAGTRLQKLYAETDGQTISELLVRPEFQKTADEGVLAAMFAKANEIEDQTARWAAKRDIMGAALGDASSIARLKVEQNVLSKEMKRFLEVPENSNGTTMFGFDDFGLRQTHYFNTKEAVDEVLAHQDEVRAEMGRLSRLAEIAGTTDRIAMTAAERLKYDGRVSQVRESVLYDGVGGRPIRVIHGAVGARVPGHIDTQDPSKGIAGLTEILSRVPDLTPAAREAYLRDFASAPDRAARNVVVWRAENAIYSSMAKAKGLTPEELRALVGSTRGVRRQIQGSLRQRVYSAADERDPVTFIDSETGEALAFDGPWIRSQFADTVPIVDPKALEYVLKIDERTRFLEKLAQRWNFDVDKATKLTDAKNYAADFFDDVAMQAMRFWKFNALFRPAYPLRVQVDTQMRNVATLGPLTWALSATKGTVNLARNQGKIFNPEFTGLQDEILAELRGIDKQVQANSVFKKGELIGYRDDTRAARLERKRAEITARLDKIPREVKRGKTDQRATQLRSKETHQGYDITPVRDGNELAVLDRTLGADGTMAQLMANGTGDTLKEMRGTGGWEVVRPGNPNWEMYYLRAVNQQFRNSPTVMAILKYNDDAMVARFIRANPEARAEYNMVKHAFPTEQAYAQYARTQVEHLVNPDVAKVLRDRALSKSDLATIFKNVGDRPAVHGENYSFLKDNPASKAVKQFSEAWYRIASDIPETVMGRHPLYNHRFRQRMREQIDRHAGEQINDSELNRIRRQSDRLARKDVAETLFDLSTQSNAAYSFRHFSPFFAAWEDTMKKWGKILYDNPELVVRGAQIWRAPNQFITVTDSEGNIVRDGKTYDASTGELITDPEYRGSEEYIMLPSWLSPGTAGGRSGIRKSSINIVFQGEPWWLPGMGPLVQVPTNEIVRRAFPKEADNPLLKYVLPYGTTSESVGTQLLPNWARQAKNLFGNSEQYAQTYAMFAAQEYALRPNEEPDPDKIANMTRNWFILKTVAAAGSPVSIRPTPKLQFYIDEAHRIRSEGGLDWLEKFYDQYPEYFEMALSLSVNNTGITASEQAYDATKRYRRFIAKNPELGWMFVGPDNVGAFDPGVYDWQQTTSVGPNSRKTFRGKEDAQDAVDNIRAQRGWIEYSKAMMFINTELEARGLHSLSQRGAEDLKATRAQYIEQLKDYNKAWGKDFDTRDSGKVQRALTAAYEAMQQDKSLANRPDMKALSQYLGAREWMRAQLAQRPRKSLDDQGNRDLAATWGQYNQELIASNLGFEQIWNRLLENDDLSREVKP